MATLFVDKIDPQSGTSLEIGSSGDTITIPSGATITNNGTQTGFGGANTPAFHAYVNSAQSVGENADIKIVNFNEVVDTDSAFASNSESCISFHPFDHSCYRHALVGCIYGRSDVGNGPARPCARRHLADERSAYRRAFCCFFGRRAIATLRADRRRIGLKCRNT